MSAASYRKACDLEEVWEGEMAVFEVDGQEILVVHATGGDIRAYDPVCPHQDHPLIEGDLTNCVLTCSAHLWQFDVVTGQGVNPQGVSLKSYPVKVEEGAVLVSLEPGAAE